MRGSLNKYSKEIIKSGIFDNINNFDDLKKRISNTKELNKRGIENTKGDIFEIFCEALLNVDKRFQAKEVYPQGYVPQKILKKLKMYDEDYGYDGLYITNDDKYIIYQSKFRSENEKIPWQGQNGLSSFVGVSKRVNNYHLISSSTQVTKYFTNVENSLLLLGNELSNFDKELFKKIENWLRIKKYQNIGKHKPDSHQIIALKKIQKEFKNNSRTTVIMACGTGKTDVGFWTYENIRPKLALVLVPSIALVKQIRSDWLSQIKNDVMTFQLCSSKDTTKQEDEYILEKKDLGMVIETDPLVLKNWLEKKQDTNKIIFSTYQSSKIIKKALRKKQLIDLAIFDEAHRTATVKKNIDSNFNFALFDKNIPIKKRLFMTATRRIISSNQTDKSGAGKLLISMDQEKIYGKICYNLGFYEAAKKYKAIARPKIILSEVLSNEVDELRTRMSSTDIKGEKIKSDYLANQISLKKAIQKKNIKKIFCFHTKVSQAKMFTNGSNPESIGYHLKKYSVDYVSGSMRMRLRDKKMQLFKSDNYSLISNARCLIEGVDVPAVGMVGFISEKKSTIDIVQAVGRALRNRNDPNKKYGYIHIPIFINKFKNQKLSDAIEKSNFDNLILVIKALKEHDSEIYQIINDLLISESRGKGFSKKAIKGISEIVETTHPTISRKIINEAIKSKIISKLRLKWDEMIGRLLSFKDMYGHLNITSEYKDYKDLYEWVLYIRTLFRKSQLYQFQINQLNSLKFNWYDHRATIYDIQNYLTVKRLSLKFKVSEDTIKSLIDKRYLKPVGKGFVHGVGITDLFKDYTEKEFLKIAKIDFLPTNNFVTANFLSKKFKINLNVMIRSLKNKSVGKTFTNRGITSVYKNYNKKQIFKIVGIDFTNTKNLYTLGGLARKLGKTSLYYSIKALYINKLIKPEGKSISPFGIRPFFKEISEKKYKKLLGIDIVDTRNYVSLKSLSRKLGIDIRSLKKLKKHLKFVGRGLSQSRSSKTDTILGVTNFYENIDKKKFFEKTGLIEHRQNLYTISKLYNLIRKKYKHCISSFKLANKLKEIGIKPVGKVISKSDQPFSYV